MKCTVLPALFFLASFYSSSAQKIERAYDFAWKETDGVPRIYAFIEKKDSVWHMQAYYLPEKSLAREATYKDDSCKIKHGSFIEFYPNKELKTKGAYVNDKPHGAFITVHENGMMWDSATYNNGQVLGHRLRWHNNGFVSDSIAFNPDGSGVVVGWFADGIPYYAGRYAAGTKRNGKWQYFQTDGKPAYSIEYRNDSFVMRQYIDESGKTVTDTSSLEREAQFNGGQSAWAKYLMSNLNPNAPITTGAPNGKYTVAIRFIVNANGKLSDIKPITNFGFGMEKEAERILKKSPAWVPAIQYGRKVKAYRIQPITFVVSG